MQLAPDRVDTLLEVQARIEILRQVHILGRRHHCSQGWFDSCAEDGVQLHVRVILQWIILRFMRLPFVSLVLYILHCVWIDGVLYVFLGEDGDN